MKGGEGCEWRVKSGERGYNGTLEGRLGVKVGLRREKQGEGGPTRKEGKGSRKMLIQGDFFNWPPP